MNNLASVDWFDRVFPLLLIALVVAMAGIFSAYFYRFDLSIKLGMVFIVIMFIASILMLVELRRSISGE